MLKKLFLIVLICAFMAPTNVFAEKSKWSFTPYLGANVATSRDMVNALSGTVAGARTFSDGSQIDGTITASISELSFSDTHDTPLLTGLDIGYFIDDNLEVFGGFQYVGASGNSTKVLDITAAGNFTDAAGTATALALNETANVEFDDYSSWAIKAGATKYFPMADFTPYVGGYAGFKHVDEMKFKLKFITAAVQTGKIKFYNSTNTGFFGFHTGVNKKISMGGTPVSLGIRARLDYTPELNNDNSDVDLLGAGKTNDAGGGVDFGLTGQLSVPF
jgi:hypothetical protein